MNIEGGLITINMITCTYLSKGWITLIYRQGSCEVGAPQLLMPMLKVVLQIIAILGLYPPAHYISFSGLDEDTTNDEREASQSYSSLADCSNMPGVVAPINPDLFIS